MAEQFALSGFTNPLLRPIAPVLRRALQVNELWHSRFIPESILKGVDFDAILEQSQRYRPAAFRAAQFTCIVCGSSHTDGLFLNDQSSLCRLCLAEVAKTSFPEKYEALRRQYVQQLQERARSWEQLSRESEYVFKESIFVLMGWASVFLSAITPAFLLLTAALLAFGYWKRRTSETRAARWVILKLQWEELHPLPEEPILKHFHDPTADLTERDLAILKVFSHWPGYPPFWPHLRSVVLERDSQRCQVTGCPSRLSLHLTIFNRFRPEACMRLRISSHFASFITLSSQGRGTIRSG